MGKDDSDCPVFADARLHFGLSQAGGDRANALGGSAIEFDERSSGTGSLLCQCNWL